MLTLISLDQSFKDLQIGFLSFIKLTLPQCESMDHLCGSVTLVPVADWPKWKLLQQRKVGCGQLRAVQIFLVGPLHSSSFHRSLSYSLCVMTRKTYAFCFA